MSCAKFPPTTTPLTRRRTPAATHSAVDGAFAPTRFILETFSCAFSAYASHIPIARLPAQGFATNGMDIAKCRPESRSRTTAKEHGIFALTGSLRSDALTAKITATISRRCSCECRHRCTGYAAQKTTTGGCVASATQSRGAEVRVQTGPPLRGQPGNGGNEVPSFPRERCD
jgi:hypothetical protein